jgi:hypothetical protein
MKRSKIIIIDAWVALEKKLKKFGRNAEQIHTVPVNSRLYVDILAVLFYLLFRYYFLRFIG